MRMGVRDRFGVGRNQQRKKENNVSVDWSLNLNAQNCHSNQQENSSNRFYNFRKSSF